MDSSEGYEEYALIADLYDHVVPYRNRPDVGFFVEAAKGSGGPVLEVTKAHLVQTILAS